MGGFQGELLILDPREVFQWYSYDKVLVNPTYLDEVRERFCAHPNDAVLQLVPPAFSEVADRLYVEMGCPPVTYESIWTVYAELLSHILAVMGMEADLQIHVAAPAREHTSMPAYAGEPMALLPYPKARPGGGLMQAPTRAGEEDGLGQLEQVEENRYSEDARSEDELVVPEWTESQQPFIQGSSRD